MKATATSTAPPPGQTINTLQAYRAVAAILVVLYHVTVNAQEKFNFSFLNDAFIFGYVGVDFFFVLSGFIIFYVHKRDLGNSQALGRYAHRRFIRIFPFYWVMTLIKLLAMVTVAGYAKDYERSEDVILKSFLVLPQINLPLIGAAWTLSHELLFYILFAAFIWLGPRFAVSSLAVWVLGILGPQFFGAAVNATDPLGLWISFVLNPRNLEFVIGCVCANVVINVRFRRGPAIALILIGVLAYVFSAIYVDRAVDVPPLYYPFVFGSASALIVVGSAAAELRGYVKVPNAMVFLGDASYSIYLTTFAFVNLLTIMSIRVGLVNMMGPPLLTAAVACLSVVGGCLTYIVIERPLLEGLRRGKMPWVAEIRGMWRTARVAPPVT